MSREAQVRRCVALWLLLAGREAGAEEPPASRFQVVVRGNAPRVDATELTVSAAQGQSFAGTQGDPLKAVQDLPGVGRAAFDSGQLVVWGAMPSQTRVLIDGVELPALYHLGGIRSVVSGDLVSSMSLTPGAFAADYGRALGGILRIESREGVPKGVHGAVRIDLLDASAVLTAGIGERLELAVAGRYGYLDRLAGALVPPAASELLPLPSYDDYQLKARLRLRSGESLSLLVLGSDDRLQRTVPAPAPAQTRSEQSERSFYRVALVYQRRSAKGDEIRVTPFIGIDRSRQEQRSGPIPTHLDRDAITYGVRASWRGVVASRLRVQGGIDLAGSRSRVDRLGSLTLPAREGDIVVFGQKPSDDLAADVASVHILDVGPYLMAQWRLGPVTISPGVRLDAYLIEGDRQTPPVVGTPPVGFARLEWGIDPRLTVLWQAHRRFELFAAAGLYHQAPEPAELSAVFGNPTLGLTRAGHVALGGTVRLTSTTRIEAVGFFRLLDQLVTRNALATPPLGRVLTQDGQGRSYGGQLLVRQELFHGFSGWLAYTLSRSEIQDQPGGPHRLSDYDQPHVLMVVANYERAGWNCGARLRFSSGFPRTAVIGAYYDVRADVDQPIFGEHNAFRIPEFVQLDLRVSRSFTLRRLTIDLSLDVQNVNARSNPEEVAYSADYARRGFITGLPTLAVLGARMGF